MKKNFVQKLALGLALVMTVTSVPATSKAAAKPAFKAASVEVEEGATVKTEIKNTKGWKAKKVVVKDGTVAEATAVQKAKKVNVKVTGLKAGETKVVTKLTNGKKVVKAKLNVTVKAPEVTTMTAEATGVKEITVNFNNAVDKTSTVAVKKGTVAPTFTAKWAEDGKSVVLAMGSKLTEGTYDVTVGKMTASVAVKDEVITSIEFVGTNLVLTAKDADTATISYKTLNQYGERMADPGKMTVASSFGAGKPEACTSKKNGVVTVTIASDILKIVGTTGTITIIDSSKGVTATANVTLSDVATPKAMTVSGVYNLTKSVFADMYRGCNPSEYVLLVQVQDQYGNALNAKAVKDAKIDTNFVGSVTNVEVDEDGWGDYTVDDVDYVALPFELKDSAEEAAVGTFYFTFVNPNAGLLATANFTVTDSTVVKSVNIYANDTIYDKQANVLGFEVVDVNGNAITKYSELKDTITFDTTSGTIAWSKQADGTARLVYQPAIGIDADNDKGTDLATIMVTANAKIPTSYVVKPVNFTVYQAKEAKEVVGLKAGSANAIATGASVRVKITDLIIEDQYSNVLTAKELKNKGVSVNVKVEEGNATLSAATVTDASPLYIKAGSDDLNVVSYSVNSQKEAYMTKYAVVEPTKATNLKVVSINDGYTIKAITKADVDAVTESAIVITGTVAGKTVVIPSTQFVVSAKTVRALGNPATVGVAQATETGSYEITVDTVNGPVVLTKEAKYSNTYAVVTELTEKEEPVEINAGTVNASVLEGLFDIIDQYGETNAVNKSGIKYNVVYLSGDKKVISHNTTNDVTFTAVSGERYSVTATIGELTVTTEFTVK